MSHQLEIAEIAQKFFSPEKREVFKERRVCCSEEEKRYRKREKKAQILLRRLVCQQIFVKQYASNAKNMAVCEK